jgi:hypothetical protein
MERDSNNYSTEEQDIWFNRRFDEGHYDLDALAMMHRVYVETLWQTRRSGDHELQDGAGLIGRCLSRMFEAAVEMEPDYLSKAIEVLGNSPNPTDRVWAGSLLWPQQIRLALGGIDDIDAEIDRWTSLLEGETSDVVMAEQIDHLEAIIYDLGIAMEDGYTHVEPFRERVRDLHAHVTSPTPDGDSTPSQPA